MGMEARLYMQAAIICILVVFCLLSINFQVSGTTYGIENKALNTPGGQRLQKELGNRALIYALENAQTFIVEAFSLDKAKSVDHITVVVEDVDGVAFTRGSDIHLSARYIAQFSPRNWYVWKREITGIMYHEMTHVFQNTDGDNLHDVYLRGVVEGIADFIRLRAGYQSWKRQRGGNWYDGYSTTAFFFDWIDKTQISSFVNRLNHKMGQTSSWTNDFFLQITKRDVETLWQEYQKSLPIAELYATS
ncbi:hypothetical protein Mapa_005384 [Marchantia paleacea]|nr:hypothetical protein Mapa_005384 [Marchantia paleacea]